MRGLLLSGNADLRDMFEEKLQKLFDELAALKEEASKSKQVRKQTNNRSEGLAEGAVREAQKDSAKSDAGNLRTPEYNGSQQGHSSFWGTPIIFGGKPLRRQRVQLSLPPTPEVTRLSISKPTERAVKSTKSPFPDSEDPLTDTSLPHKGNPCVSIKEPDSGDEIDLPGFSQLLTGTPINNRFSSAHPLVERTPQMRINHFIALESDVAEAKNGPARSTQRRTRPVKTYGIPTAYNLKRAVMSLLHSSPTPMESLCMSI